MFEIIQTLKPMHNTWPFLVVLIKNTESVRKYLKKIKILRKIRLWPPITPPTINRFWRLTTHFKDNLFFFQNFFGLLIYMS